MSFLEVRFPTNCITDISGGGPEFVTIRTTVRSGKENAVSIWDYPRTPWILSSRQFTKAKYDELYAFFMNTRGAFHGFRFRDPRDYLVGRTTTDGITFTEAPVSALQLTTTTFQIQKPYTYGGNTHNIPIYKIDGDNLADTAAEETDSSVRVYQADGTTEVTSGWTVNLTNGVITFSVAPGYVPKVSCKFDYPVRFDDDRLPTTLEGIINAASGIRLVEIKQL